MASWIQSAKVIHNNYSSRNVYSSLKKKSGAWLDVTRFTLQVYNDVIHICQYKNQHANNPTGPMDYAYNYDLRV